MNLIYYFFFLMIRRPPRSTLFPFPRHVRPQPEWPQPRDLGGRRAEAPRLGQAAFLVCLLEQVPREDGQAVEEALRRGVGLLQVDGHAMGVELAHDHWLAPHDEQVALRRAV